MIYSKKKCIDDRIMKEMHRGVTYWQGKGAYTNEDSLILVTVISKYEISQLKKIVKEIDKYVSDILCKFDNAFMPIV